MVDNAIVQQLRRVPASAWVYAVLILASLAYTFPLWSESGVTLNKLMVHVRYVYEYVLAWREGQWLPLVAPLQNGEIRNPVFQYYSGTGYLIPALFVVAGLSPYHAFITTIAFASFAAGAALYHICKMFGVARVTALVIALLGLFSPIAITCLYATGLYAEWESIAFLPVILWALLGLVTPATPDAGYKVRLGLTSLLIALYLPIHPVHSVFSFNLIVLLACVYAYAKGYPRSIGYILLSVWFGGLACAWYWLPIAQSFSSMRMSGELGLSSTGAHLSDVLFPWLRTVGGWDYGFHTPQVGWYFFAFSVFTVCFLRTFRTGLVAAWLFLAIVIMVTSVRPYPFLYEYVSRLFSFAQWDYRLLFPLGLIGALVAVDFFLFLQRRNYRKTYRFLLCLLALCAAAQAWQYTIMLKYGLKKAHAYEKELGEAIAEPGYWSNNPGYALFGTDFRNFDFSKGDIAAGRYKSQNMGLPYLFSLKIRADEGGSAQCPLTVTVSEGRAIPQTCTLSSDGGYLLTATMEGGGDILFTKNVAGSVTVDDYYFQSPQDGGDKKFRIPPHEAVRSASPGGISLAVTIPAGKAGLYQLPFCYWPGLGMTVNGHSATQQSSDRFMVVTHLEEGKNTVEFYNRWTLAKGISVLGLLLAVGFIWLDCAWLERKAQAWLELRAPMWKKIPFPRLRKLRPVKYARQVTLFVKKLYKARSVWLEAVIVSVLPCLLLFNINNGHYDDWYNHTWEIGYYGAYFRDHFSFPKVFNTNELFGIAFPVFYGYGLFPLLGLPATIFHPHVVVLFAVYGLYVLQYGAITLLLMRMALPRWFASMTAIIVAFSIYPLTNLYSRSALPEFFAGIALTIGITALLLSIVSEEPGRRQRWHAITLAAFALMAVAHPVTLMNAALFMAAICPLFVWIYRREAAQIIYMMAAIPLMLLPLLAPWIYALYSVKGTFTISTTNRFQMYPEDIDWIVTRLSPVLFDRRNWFVPVSAISTPFLDAPANIFLLFMAAILIAGIVRQFGFQRKILIFTGIMAALFVFYVWCSVSDYPWRHLFPHAFQIIQLPYRLVTMINLSAFVLLLGGGLWLKHRNASLALPYWVLSAGLIVCTGASFAFVQKMIHGAVVNKPMEASLLVSDNYRTATLNSRPGTFWAIFDYATPSAYKEVEQPQNFVFDTINDKHACVRLGSIELNATYKGYGMGFNPSCARQQVEAYDIRDSYAMRPMPARVFVNPEYRFKVAAYPFADPLPLHVHSEGAGWYKTNITTFSWNRILVDGKEAIPLRSSVYLSIYLLPGDHELAYVFAPPVLWGILNYVKCAATFFLFCYLFLPVLRRMPARVKNVLRSYAR